LRGRLDALRRILEGALQVFAQLIEPVGNIADVDGWKHRLGSSPGMAAIAIAVAFAGAAPGRPN
jgi:hypothetical protein